MKSQPARLLLPPLALQQPRFLTAVKPAHHWFKALHGRGGGKLQWPPRCCGQEFSLAGQGLLHTEFKGLTELLARAQQPHGCESTSSFSHREGSIKVASPQLEIPSPPKQNEVGQGFEQHDVMKDVQTHGSGVGLDGL